MVYFLKKHKVDKNTSLSNKLLRIIYTLIQKQILYDQNYIQPKPRLVYL